MHADASQPSNIECPRCGHQLGVMADEADRRGDTHGKCGECGLDIEWRKLRDDAVAQAWYIEWRSSQRSIVRRACGTLLRTARPFRFWSSIDLALPLSPGRLAVFVLAVLTVLHLMASGQRIAIGAPNSRGVPPPAASIQRAQTIGRVALALLMPLSRYDGEDIVSGTHGVTGESETLPLLGLAAPPILKAALPWDTGLIVVTRSVATTQTYSANMLPMAPPLLTPALAHGALVLVAPALLSPLALLLLPTSLRRARVRPRHFVRIMALGVVVAIPIFAAIIAADHFVRHFRDSQRFETQPHLYPFGAFGEVNPFFVLMLFTSLVTAAWLTAACSRYLRLPHALGVGVSCALIAMLAAGVLMFVA